MAIFPERFTGLDLKDIPGSLRKVEDYIRYMTERMEFYGGKTNKQLEEEISALKERLTTLEGGTEE